MSICSTFFRSVTVLALMTTTSRLSVGQVGPSVVPPVPDQVASSDQPRPAEESKRLFGIIPNFRTSPSLAHYKPLAPADKLKIASQDAFDRGTFILAAAFAGESQLTKAEPSFGQGAAGFGRYLGTSYADYVIGDYMTEAIFPTLLHQDPRYFRSGQGSPFKRLGYAAGQILLTHSDNGQTQFNYSEILGNSAAVAISTSYYPDNRNISDAISKLGTQLGVDMASNILKEFAPDIARKFSRKQNRAARSKARNSWIGL